jgi:hypothetical protein
MLEQHPIGWKDLSVSDHMRYKIEDDSYWKGYWDSVKHKRIPDSRLDQKCFVSFEYSNVKLY